MRATKSQFEVPNERFKGIWNLIFQKKVRFGVKTSIWALVWNGPQKGIIIGRRSPESDLPHMYLWMDETVYKWIYV